MKRQGNLLKRILYKNLPFETYLNVLSRLYFISFNSGLLKKNRLYDYPYFLKNIISQGDICIDIGANLGYLTVLFSKLVGKNGKVYAVEPVKPVLTVLQKNTKRLKNVEILPFALGAENKSIRLGNNTLKNAGFVATGSHFVLDNKITQSQNADVEFEAIMKKGSELFKDFIKLDFIKCDIEGYEIVVIPEMESVIKKFTPILLVETRRENRKKLLQFFMDINYKGYVLYKNFLYPAKEDEYWDILFVPEEKMETVRNYVKKE
jgi:FkbM family methyltransferase